MSSNKRINKGSSLLCFPAEYVALDLETTGLSPEYDEIIEMAAVKISNGEIIDQYESLIRPSFPVDNFITDLTGITNEMLSDAPRIEDELHTFLDFVGNNIVVGHNVNFDINFIYDNSESVLNKPFINDFVDTLRLSRRFYPEMPHHRLSDLKEKFNISDTEHHRALADCISSYRCFEAIHHDLLLRFENNDALSDALNSKKPVIDLHKTVNSSGRRTSSTGIPGTGISYSTSRSSRSPSSKKRSATANSAVTKIPSRNVCKVVSYGSLAFFVVFLFTFLWCASEVIRQANLIYILPSAFFFGVCVKLFGLYRHYDKLCDWYDDREDVSEGNEYFSEDSIALEAKRREQR